MTPDELKTWRKQASLSQGNLAVLLGVDVITVSRWETGRRKIPPFLELALITLTEELLDVRTIDVSTMRVHRSSKPRLS